MTTFQVTSATGSAIVHNTGQEVQVTHNVTAGNPPTYTTCGSADSNVTCRVISSSWNAVTLGITAGTSAVHGTRVLSLNGGAATAHAAVADSWGSDLPTIRVEVGGSASALAPPLPACVLYGYCSFAEVTRSEGWIWGFGISQVMVFAKPPLGTAPGSYMYWVDACAGDWSAEDGMNQCEAGPGYVIVTAASCSAGQSVLAGLSPLLSSLPRAACTDTVTVTLGPSSLALSTGDTDKVITTSILPNNVPFQVVYSSARTDPPPPGTFCDATLGIPTTTGTGTFNVPVTAASPNCSGTFTVVATASIYNSQNSVSVIVPPQALIRQMMGEAHGFSDQPSLDPNQVAQISVGVAAKNRFTLPGFGGYTTWQGFQDAGKIATYNVSNGPPIVIGNAVAVYTGLVDGSFVGGAPCYWSPLATQFQIIPQQYQSNPNSTTTPSGTGAPTCYTQPGQYQQFVWKVSMPNNTRNDNTGDYRGAPAFLFVRQRSASDPAIVQIP